MANSPTPEPPSEAAAAPSSTSTSTTTTATAPTNNEAASKLAEALDDFLGDVERKFKGLSDEFLTRLDEMAERCDRLEAELLRREIGQDGKGATDGGVGGGSVV